MAWIKGQSGNPAGSKKKAFAEDFDNLKAKKEAIDKAHQIFAEEFPDIFYSMCDLAKKGNVQAARYVTEYVIGKPKETVIHDITDEAKKLISINITKDEASL